MAEHFEITEEMRKVVGVESRPWTYEVTSTGARMFARGVGYADPVYFALDDARAAGYDAIPAAPGYLGTPVYDPRVCDPKYGQPHFEDDPSLDLDLPNVLDGGTETIYERPVVVGDVFQVSYKIADLTTRQSDKLGTMVVVSREATYRDGDDNVVARQLTDGIYY